MIFAAVCGQVQVDIWGIAIGLMYPRPWKKLLGCPEDSGGGMLLVRVERNHDFHAGTRPFSALTGTRRFLVT